MNFPLRYWLLGYFICFGISYVVNYPKTQRDRIHYAGLEVVDVTKTGFRIVRYQDHYYAFPFTEGFFDLERFKKAAYSMQFESRSRDKVLSLSRNAKHKPYVFKGRPYLAYEGYKGYNLVLCDEKFYGVKQGSGGFDLQSSRASNYIIGDSLKDVRSKIDKMTRESLPKN